MENEQKLEQFCRDFASLQGPKVLVHGGGVMASELMGRLGMEAQMIEGRRVTDAQTLQTVTMVYAGWCNKHIVALLQKYSCNALGLSGCDASVIKARRRAPRTLKDGKTVVDYGLVGDVDKSSVNADALRKFLEAGLCPVLCAINHDGQGQLLNTNADTVASAVACSINAKLVYCFEKNGVLYDRFDPESIIGRINPLDFTSLVADGKVADGMIPKIENAFKALQDGAAEVVIKNSDALLKDEGTHIVL